jgi:RNA polymerase sigma factor (TIGR02999 family)
MGSRDITELLLAWSRGDRQAGEELLPRLYGELRRMAARYLARERRDHTLQPTALVHEAFLRLVDQRQVEWQSRAHFFAVAATAMRRVLLDHTRRRQAAKRGGASTPITLVQGFDVRFEREVELLALDEALQRLEAMDRFKARLVDSRVQDVRLPGRITSDNAQSPRKVPDRRWRDRPVRCLRGGGFQIAWLRWRGSGSRSSGPPAEVDAI